MKKIMCFMLFVFCVLFIGCAEAEFDEESGKLIVGLECDYAPFNWTETVASDDNVPIYGEKNLYVAGYDIEIAKLIAADLGKELIVKKISWNGLIPALTNGKIDLVIAGMSPTLERQESINFTNHYYKSNHVVIVKKDGNYNGATKFSDFANARIIGQKGTSYEILASQLSKEAKAINQVPIDTIPMIIANILNNVSDVTIVEKPVAISACYNNPECMWIELEDTFDVDPVNLLVSIGVRKNDTSLLERCNEALAKISEETRTDLMNKAAYNGK